MEVKLIEIYENISYFLPYVIVSYVLIFIFYLFLIRKTKNFNIGDSDNFLYGMLIDGFISITTRLSILCSKFIFTALFFIFSLEHKPLILIFFIFLDLMFFISKLNVVSLLLQILNSIAIYIFMFATYAIRDYMLNVDKSIIIVFIYICMAIFVVLYTLCMSIFMASRAIIVIND